MHRREFVKTMAAVPLMGAVMNLNELNKMVMSYGSTEQMPVLFVGHGSPMNAIEENVFVRGWRDTGKSLPRPNAILCVSAHWETRGTWVTAMPQPKTIHDFGGFPQELYEVQYPAPGDPQLAKDSSAMIDKASVGLDQAWGLDHGCWSVLRRMYPEADVPVVQLSLDYTQPAQYHYDLAKELAGLRKKGILIMGSGNLVHNLRLVAWDQLDQPGYAYDWATEANDKMKQFILSGDHKSLIDYRSQGKAFDLAIPTPEHYLPLLYTLALQEEGEKVEFFNDDSVGGSLTMTSVKMGG
jgi:4,5-DOPA dioxygenase extradiol